jgi:undecaprenyl-diphosphatase
MDLSFLASPVIQLGLIALLFVLYSVVSLAVSRNRFLAEWDVPFGAWAVGKNTPVGYRLFRILTELGSYKAVRFGTVVLCIGLLAARDWSRLVMLVGVFGLTMLVNHFLKLVVPRTRPDFPQNYLYDESFSYPSGHTMLATAFYLMVADLAWVYLTDPVVRWTVLLLVLALIMLIGFSRIYLGVHFLTDVVGGWIAGSLMFWLVLLAGNFLFYKPLFHL